MYSSIPEFPKGQPVNWFIIMPITTPGKINMEPDNTSLEKENHLPNHHFQVLLGFV